MVIFIYRTNRHPFLKILLPMLNFSLLWQPVSCNVEPYNWFPLWLLKAHYINSSIRVNFTGFLFKLFLKCTSLICHCLRSVRIYITWPFRVTPQWSCVRLRSWCVSYDPFYWAASLLSRSPATHSILKITRQDALLWRYLATCTIRQRKMKVS